MKNIYTLFVLAAMLTGQSACKKDEEPAKAPCHITYTPYYASDNPGDPFVLYLNGQQQLDHIISDDTRYDFRYEGNKLTILKNNVAEAAVNLANGRVINVTSQDGAYYHTFSYNKDGYLDTVKFYINSELFQIYAMTYENGNLKKRVDISPFPDAAGMKQETVFTYTADVADNVLIYTQLFERAYVNLYIPPTLLGRQSRNVLAKSVFDYEFGANATHEEKTYTYTKEQAGSINSQKMQQQTLTYYNGSLSDTDESGSEWRFTSDCDN